MTRCQRWRFRMQGWNKRAPERKQGNSLQSTHMLVLFPGHIHVIVQADREALVTN